MPVFQEEPDLCSTFSQEHCGFGAVESLAWLTLSLKSLYTVQAFCFRDLKMKVDDI